MLAWAGGVELTVTFCQGDQGPVQLPSSARDRTWKVPLRSPIGLHDDEVPDDTYPVRQLLISVAVGVAAARISMRYRTGLPSGSVAEVDHVGSLTRVNCWPCQVRESLGTGACAAEGTPASVMVIFGRFGLGSSALSYARQRVIS